MMPARVPAPHITVEEPGIERLRALAIPKRYRDASLEGFETEWCEKPENRQRLRVVKQLATQLCHEWQTHTLVTILGASGSGKDHLAWAIVRSIVYHQGASVIVSEWAKIMRRLRETWRKDAKATEAEVIATYVRADILVVREVSHHAFYGNPTQHFMDVIGEREQEMRLTIITTNESRDSLRNITGSAMSDRMQTIWFTGTESFRGLIP